MNKKIRRCLSLLLVAAMLVTGLDFVPAKAAETTYTSGDYTYTLNGDDEATITKYDGSASYVAIPSTLDGKQVVGIGDGVFQDKKTITGVNIPEGIKSIGHDAFAHTNLQELNLPSSLERIGYSVIYGVTGVTNVNIPKGLKTADVCWNNDGPFAGSKVNTVTFESGMTKIPDNMMKNCKELKTVTIPYTVQEIGQYAFDSCSSLEKIEIPRIVKTIGHDAFAHTNLQELNLPSSLEKIGYSIIYGVTRVTSVNIPKGVKTADVCWNNDGPFAGSKVNKVTFEKGTKLIPANLFSNASQLREVKLLDEMTDIDSYAFENCTNLRSIELPISIKTIGDGAFSGCTSLTEVLANKKITSIGKNAFQNCTNATIKVAKYTDSMKSFTDAEQNLEFSNLEYTDTVDKVIEHEKSMYEINGSSASSYVVMNLDYALKQKEIKNVKDMQLVVKLPATSVVNSIKLDGIALSDSDFKITSDNKITIPVKKAQENAVYTRLQMWMEE